MPSNDGARPAKATFRKSDGTVIPIQFNPVSLQSTVSNSLSQQGQGQGQRTQYVSQSSAKLTMDLIFDSTDAGTDVRERTFKVAQLMEPKGADGSPSQREAPDAVEFSWGTFSFTGIVESFRETLDFFAPEGIPLRSSVNITLTKQSHVFDRDPRLGTLRHEEPRILGIGSRSDVTSVAGIGGDPADWRDLAIANGIENPRNPETTTMAVGSGVDNTSGVTPAANSASGFDVGGRAQSPEANLAKAAEAQQSMRDALRT